MAVHRFKVGDFVELVKTPTIYAPPGPYKVVRLVPEADGDPQYRIKTSREDHERLVKQSALRPYR